MSGPVQAVGVGLREARRAGWRGPSTSGPATAIPTPRPTAATRQAPRRSGASPTGTNGRDNPCAALVSSRVLALARARAAATTTRPPARPGPTRSGRRPRRPGSTTRSTDVLADAAGAVDETYRVVYELDGRVVTVTQRPPDRRVDVVNDDGSADATISVDGTAYACTDPPGDEEWRCEVLGDPTADGAFGDADVTELAGRADGRRRGLRVLHRGSARSRAPRRPASSPAFAPAGPPMRRSARKASCASPRPARCSSPSARAARCARPSTPPTSPTTPSSSPRSRRGLIPAGTRHGPLPFRRHGRSGDLAVDLARDRGGVLRRRDDDGGDLLPRAVRAGRRRRRHPRLRRRRARRPVARLRRRLDRRLRQPPAPRQAPRPR